LYQKTEAKIEGNANSRQFDWIIMLVLHITNCKLKVYQFTEQSPEGGECKVRKKKLLLALAKIKSNFMSPKITLQRFGSRADY
jgi:hypothetical protein